VAVEMRQIMIALTAGESPALGNIWRITSKTSDFYLDFVGDAGTLLHLSVHGPGERFDRHRFHIKVDRQGVTNATAMDQYLEHNLPRKGFSFNGQEVGTRAFRVARIRWTWHLQRPRFRSAAISGEAPDIASNQSGARLSELLAPNGAWDVDVVVSYDKPYWPDPVGSLRDDARLGPLANNAGMWLTATSYHRSQLRYPTPEHMSVPLPAVGERPNRMLLGGFGPDDVNDMYWFVETITSREFIQARVDGAGL
jgi:hypothetical protein